MTRREELARQGDATDPQAGPPVADPAGSAWRLRNWRLRTKLFVLLLVPAVAVVALVGLRVKSDLDEAKQLAQLAARGPVDGSVAEVLHQLQRERDLTVRFVAGDRKGDMTAVRIQRQRVDMAVGNFDRALADSGSRLTERAAESLRRTKDRLGVLTGLRFSGEHSAFPADAVLRSYSELISGMLEIGDSSAADISDPELARERLASNALAKVKEQVSVKRAIMAEAIAQGSLSNDHTRALLGADAELTSARNDYRTFASSDQQRMYDDTVIGLIVDTGNEMVESALTRAENNEPLNGLDADRWDVAATYTGNLVHQVQKALLVQMQTRTDALAARARTSTIWDSAIVVAVLLAAGMLSVIIARSLLRPLRILRGSALEVAEHRLPEVVNEILRDPEPQQGNGERRFAVAPVPLFSREEFGQVARAFDAVHGEAVRLAAEQAMLRENVNSMFVNLSRRSQDLVERQLSVLDRMEAGEQDPDVLGGLFELDHLATRMRRNSENLLVLSGTELGRAASEPVSAEEIIGAALSEVEHYQRIEIAVAPALVVHGEAVDDLVHVVSELLENATIYSGEETTVEVVSVATETGAWRIDITDRGAGMPQAEIDRANERLANPPEVDVEVSRRMGLYVVATLANRHHIGVRLRSVAEGGLAATVIVPTELVTLLSPDVEPEAHPASSEESLFAVLEPESETPLRPDPGPPRRAPVIEQDVAPDWPKRDGDSAALDVDAPTERNPVLRNLLSEWFQAGGRPSPRASPMAEPEPWPEEESELEPVWPSAAEVERENGAEYPFSGVAVGSPAEPAGGRTHDARYQWPDTGRPMLSLAPEALRARMSNLQGALRRGRHSRRNGGTRT